MNDHVKLLGVLYLLYHGIGVLAAAAIFVFLAGLGLLAGDLMAMGMLGVIGVVVGGLLLVLALPGLIGGLGLLAGKSWARILVLILGVIHLFEVPLGTALGIYTIWVLQAREPRSYG